MATLKSTSAGSFHLVHLTFDDFVLCLVEVLTFKDKSKELFRNISSCARPSFAELIFEDVSENSETLPSLAYILNSTAVSTSSPNVPQVPHVTSSTTPGISPLPSMPSDPPILTIVHEHSPCHQYTMNSEFLQPQSQHMASLSINVPSVASESGITVESFFTGLSCHGSDDFDERIYRNSNGKNFTYGSMQQAINVQPNEANYPARDVRSSHDDQGATFYGDNRHAECSFNDQSNYYVDSSSLLYNFNLYTDYDQLQYMQKVKMKEN